MLIHEGDVRLLARAVVARQACPHERDPLGGLLLKDEDYGWITAEIRKLAESHCGGKIVSMLEGGYGEGDTVTVDAPPALVWDQLQEPDIWSAIGPVEQVFMSHYDSVTSVGETFEELGYSKATGDAEGHRFAAIGSDELRRYGFQFHPEVDDTLRRMAAVRVS